MRTNLMRPIVALACAGLLLGCGDGGPRRYDISGEVTFAGRPVPAGQILFEPDAAAGNDGPQGYADIKNGRFDSAQSGRGTIAGPHRVRVTGLDGRGGSDDAPQGAPLFRPYETNADLPASRHTLDIVVPGSAATGDP